MLCVAVNTFSVCVFVCVLFFVPGVILSTILTAEQNMNLNMPTKKAHVADSV